MPSIPFRTEVHRQTVLVAPDALAAISNPEAASRPAVNRAFWQRYINTAVFDHPDQPTPRHGGDNWVRLPLPGEVNLTAYRSTGNGHIGFFLSGNGAGADCAPSLVKRRSCVQIRGFRVCAFTLSECRINGARSATRSGLKTFLMSRPRWTGCSMSATGSLMRSGCVWRGWQKIKCPHVFRLRRRVLTFRRSSII